MPPKKRVKLGRPKKKTAASVIAPVSSDTETESVPIFQDHSEPQIPEHKKSKNVLSFVKRLIVKGFRRVLPTKSDEEQSSSPLVSKKSAKLEISTSSKSEASFSNDPENLSLKRLQISFRLTKQSVIKHPMILKTDSALPEQAQIWQ